MEIKILCNFYQYFHGKFSDEIFLFLHLRLDYMNLRVLFDSQLGPTILFFLNSLIQPPFLFKHFLFSHFSPLRNISSLLPASFKVLNETPDDVFCIPENVFIIVFSSTLPTKFFSFSFHPSTLLLPSGSNLDYSFHFNCDCSRIPGDTLHNICFVSFDIISISIVIVLESLVISFIIHASYHSI